MSEQKQKTYGEDSDGEGFDVGFKLPETRSILERLPTRQDVQQEHNQIMDSEDKEDKKKGKKPKKRQRRGGSVCFCGNPFCRIGPFQETQGGEDVES